MKRIGIMGGMGPAATADLFQKIIANTEATSDQDHIPLIIDNYPQIYDRTSFIMHQSANNPLPQMIESAQRLKKAGCETIAIACNTAHYFVEDLLQNVDIEVLHIVDINIETIRTNYPHAKKIAVLATDGTIASGIYKNRLVLSGLDAVDIPVQLQRSLMECIYDGAKAGKITEYGQMFNDIICGIEADVFVLACTELPLFINELKHPVVYIDATNELAKYIVSYSQS